MCCVPRARNERTHTSESPIHASIARRVRKILGQEGTEIP